MIYKYVPRDDILDYVFTETPGSSRPECLSYEKIKWDEDGKHIPTSLKEVVDLTALLELIDLDIKTIDMHTLLCICEHTLQAEEARSKPKPHYYRLNYNESGFSWDGKSVAFFSNDIWDTYEGAVNNFKDVEESCPTQKDLEDRFFTHPSTMEGVVEIFPE